MLTIPEDILAKYASQWLMENGVRILEIAKAEGAK